jgi:hypothetical protein
MRASPWLGIAMLVVAVKVYKSPIFTIFKTRPGRRRPPNRP